MMKEYEVRQLTENDADELEALVNSHKKLQRVFFDMQELKVREKVTQYYGAWEDGELVACLRCIRMTHHASTYIGPWLVKQGVNNTFSWQPERSPARVLVAKVCADMEAEGRYTFWYNRSLEKWPEKFRHLGRDFMNATGVTERYTRYVEEILEPGTRSKYHLHDAFLMHREWPIRIMIAKFCLKSEFRNVGYELEEENEPKEA